MNPQALHLYAHMVKAHHAQQTHTTYRNAFSHTLKRKLLQAKKRREEQQRKQELYVLKKQQEQRRKEERVLLQQQKVLNQLRTEVQLLEQQLATLHNDTDQERALKLQSLIMRIKEKIREKEKRLEKA